MAGSTEDRNEATGRGDSTDEPAERPTVLVVDDDRDIRDLFSAWLSGRCVVRTAPDGYGAIEELDGSVDVALLDRRMPGRSGDEVLDEMTARGYDCRVAMVTAVEPDFDIIEMGFDDYLTKPVDREELLKTVEQLVTRDDYDEQMREYFALASKKAVLDAQKMAEEREASDEYAELEREVARAREELDEMLEGLDDEEFVSLYRDLGDAG